MQHKENEQADQAEPQACQTNALPAELAARRCNRSGYATYDPAKSENGNSDGL